MGFRNSEGEPWIWYKIPFGKDSTISFAKDKNGNILSGYAPPEGYERIIADE